MPLLTDRTLLASAAQSGSGIGAAIDLGVDTTLDLDLTVTAIAGSLAVTVETSKDATVGWHTKQMIAGDSGDAIAFPSVAAVGLTSVTFTDLERYVRVTWTLTGTATFSVTGNSVRVYAKPTDIPVHGAHQKLFAAVSSKKRDAQLREMTDHVDSAVAMQGEAPLDKWGSKVRAGCAACAACALMGIDGERPGQDMLIVKRCKQFDAWLDLVAEGKRKVDGTDQTPDVDEGGSYVVCETPRGW